jgi:hypothetical protein
MSRNAYIEFELCAHDDTIGADGVCILLERLRVGIAAVSHAALINIADKQNLGVSEERQRKKKKKKNE